MVRKRYPGLDQTGPDRIRLDRCVLYLYMCRLSGPSRLDEDGPDEAGSGVTGPRLNGLE